MKEKVIVFSGEEKFIKPRNRSYNVDKNYSNLVGDDKPPVDNFKEPDLGKPTPLLTTTGGTTGGTGSGGSTGGGGVTTTPVLPPAESPTITPVTVTNLQLPTLPMGLGMPLGYGGGGGGGGGGSADEQPPVEEPKSYWWLILVGLVGVILLKSKKLK
jgi:hypothetical protein